MKNISRIKDQTSMENEVNTSMRFKIKEKEIILYFFPQI